MKALHVFLPVFLLLLGASITRAQTITGSGTTNYVPKFTGTTSIGNSMIFENGIGVGIGTTNPLAKLHVSGSVNIGNTSVPDGDRLYLKSSTGTWAMNAFGTDLRIFPGEGNPVAMYLKSTGNVGIGTTGPFYKLDVAGVINANSGISSNAVAFRVNGTEALWKGSDGHFSWGYGGTYNFFGDGITIGTSDVAPPSGGLVVSGNVGIGTTTPVVNLDILSNTSGTGDSQLRVRNTGSGRANMIVDANAGIASLIFKSLDVSKWQIGKHSDNQFFMYDVVNARDFFRVNTTGNISLQPFGGNVGIGTTNPDTFKLSVNGTIKSKEIVVTLDGGWADVVFDDNYSLTPLVDLEKHIKENKHLPGIPTAQDVSKQGISVGEMQAKLLQKIEELTLYVIELKKENDALKLRVATMDQK